VLPQLFALAALTTSVAPTGGALPAPRQDGCDGAAPGAARVVLERMTEPQRVGQLFMVGTPASSPSRRTATAISRHHVGNVMLAGRSRAGVRATARLVAGLQSRATPAATAGVRLLVSTDQEGGAVQVLRGPGISSIPSALGQQREYDRARLRAAAGRWARQLRAAGVNMDLAPVLDAVPSPHAARHNPPIGAFDREYGFSPRVVAGHGTAFAAGLDRNRVLPTVKHFPGLGRVDANTDTARGVTDRRTRRHDRYLRPFRTAIASGHAPFVMMSTAFYPRLDQRHPAAFSPFVIRRVLRGDLGFSGVVVSDDLGSARQVAAWPYGRRAVSFLRAGGDLVLTADPASVAPMYHRVLSLARHDAAFRRRVDAAALRILRVKEDDGLLGHQPPLADVPLLPPTPLPDWLRVPGAVADAGRGCSRLS
jgi:beta-N-acetylhexosaminidase